MAYQRPMVMVYQEYDSTSVSTSTAQLPACIVGPCNHIVDAEEDETLALYGTYTKTGITNAMFPNMISGAAIQPDSVKFRFKNAMVELDTVAAATDGGSSAAGGTDDGDDDDDLGISAPGMDDSSAEDTPERDAVSEGNTFVVPAETLAKAMVGDYVFFSGSSTEYRVIGLGAGKLILNRTCPETGTISLQRKIEEFYVTPGVSSTGYVYLDLTSERFTVTGIKYTIDGVDYSVQTSELYVGYTALRKDLSDIMVIYNIDECVAKLGKISPDNPLAFGVAIALANSSTVGVQALGVDSDNLEGYTRAKDRLEQQDPVYGIVPLTFDTGVLTMFKNHCEAYSDPKVSRWRMTFGCTQLAKVNTLCSGKATVARDGDNDLVVLQGSTTDIEFLSSSVDSGDTLIMTDALGNTHDYVIATVASEDILTIKQSDPFDAAAFRPGTEYNFTITHVMDRDEQAKWLKSASQAYGYRRFVNIYPDVCVVDSVEVPGYYLGCAVAAGVASLPSHYGMTRLSVSGISAVKNSGDYFNNDQLDTIADGGTLIFVQHTKTSVPYIRHQLTTDRSTVEYQELSFVKNFDYVSYVCRDVLNEFIGKYNITQTTLASIKTALLGTLETMKLDAQPKIGSRVLDYNVVSIQQLADVRDRVEAYVNISMPYPLNTIGLHLKSVFLQVSSS